MTNYNERLDDVVSLIGVPLPIEQAIHAKDTAKQALTSLIKELVAEAKPESQSWDGLDFGVVIRYRACCTDCFIRKTQGN